ncbi:MAG: ATP-binding cassette domain-containing protein [Desulfovibrio sp.]|jgi:peptide/nickel transport system ATP-binding protein|nr:ATP-binding cassette domain-containing protein [Desulfovibrio sp.]
MALLLVDRVWKTFTPGTYAVKNVGFTLERGQCLGIAGESGSGKSTLIRIIARILDLSPGPRDAGGIIWLEGRDIGLFRPSEFASSPLRAKIQMVFQDPVSSLNPCFTAFRTIADPLRTLAGMRKKEAIRRRVLELADMVQLSHDLLKDRLPHQLSGGQQARVGIARALAPEPAILLLDEPTTALDVSVQGQILALLDDLRKSMGLAMVFVSHDLSVLRLLCDRLLVMLKGEVVEEGTVEAIFGAPRTDYTRQLMDAMPVLLPR